MKALNVISAVVFFVKDLHRTVAFYQDALGLSLSMIDSHDGSFATSDVGQLTLVFIPSEETPGRSPVVVFGLDGGIEDVVEGLAGQGVEIVTPVSEAPDGGLTSDFLDPDGHVLSLYQPASAEQEAPFDD
jgi:predicted enzyme related to lactoylglutathione lyase